MSTRFTKPKAPRRRSVQAFAAALLGTWTVLVGAGPALAGSPTTLTIDTQTTLVQPAGGAGYKFFDTATLSGAPLGLPAPTGTVTFNVYGPIAYPFVYGPESCAGTPQYTSTNPVNSAGTSATSNMFIPPSGEGKLYLFTASYSGDAFYAPVTNKCAAEGASVGVPGVACAEMVSSWHPRRGSSKTDISKVTFSPAVFAVAGIKSPRKRSKTRRSPSGTHIRYALSRPGRVVITIRRRVPGPKITGGGCTPGPLRRLLVFKKVGTLVRSGRAGSNDFYFTGRLKGRALTPGAYMADATVISNGIHATTSTRFQILPAAP
jgi:hypothetical protein